MKGPWFAGALGAVLWVGAGPLEAGCSEPRSFPSGRSSTYCLSHPHFEVDQIRSHALGMGGQTDKDIRYFVQDEGKIFDQAAAVATEAYKQRMKDENIGTKDAEARNRIYFELLRAAATNARAELARRLRDVGTCECDVSRDLQSEAEAVEKKVFDKVAAEVPALGSINKVRDEYKSAGGVSDTWGFVKKAMGRPYMEGLSGGLASAVESCSEMPDSVRNTALEAARTKAFDDFYAEVKSKMPARVGTGGPTGASGPTGQGGSGGSGGQGGSGGSGPTTPASGGQHVASGPVSVSCPEASADILVDDQPCTADCTWNLDAAPPEVKAEMLGDKKDMTPPYSKDSAYWKWREARTNECVKAGGPGEGGPGEGGPGEGGPGGGGTGGGGTGGGGTGGGGTGGGGTGGAATGDYVVPSGDTLGAIATLVQKGPPGTEIPVWGTGGLVELLGAANCIANVNMIYAGETLLLPDPAELKSAKGGRCSKGG